MIFLLEIQNTEEEVLNVRPVLHTTKISLTKYKKSLLQKHIKKKKYRHAKLYLKIF